MYITHASSPIWVRNLTGTPDQKELSYTNPCVAGKTADGIGIRIWDIICEIRLGPLGIREDPRQEGNEFKDFALL